MRYRKKPVEIEAWQFLGTLDNAPSWVKDSDAVHFEYVENDPDSSFLIIETLEGNHKATIQDFIIQGVRGELYPCKPDIFVATYDAVDD